MTSTSAPSTDVSDHHFRASTRPGITVISVDTPTLGNRSYLVHDGEVAFAVDPQRDIDRILGLIAEHEVRLTHVFETHIHNDYVTGGYALAAETGAAYLVNADDDVSFDRTPISHGDVISVGERMRVTALATPGHTFTHLSYSLADGDGDAVAVFSGGSLLYGSTGRPDLLGQEFAEDLARRQYASADMLARELPDDAALLPTHGFGSFCSSSQSSETGSTIGSERAANPVLTLDEQTFVDELLAGLSDHPAYYAHMASRNEDGPAAADLTPPAVADAFELRRRIEAGEWVVDLRHRTAFAAGHAAGTLNFGLDGSLATYLGWLIPWGTPVTLLGESAADVAEAQLELARIGIDRPAAQATGDPTSWSTGPLVSFPMATFADLAAVRHHRPVVVLDVRRSDERRGGHIAGSVHIPLHRLTSRVDEVPDGEVWVHCAAGYRASIAASVLDAAHRTVIAIDDGFDNAARAGLVETRA